MHASVITWVGAKVDELDLAAGHTLEVGSYNVNGSVRPLFTGRYVGVDMRDGPGVDKVCNAHVLPWKRVQFDTVVCTEMLEHDPAFWLSVPEMVRVLRPGGALLLTARGIGFPPHDHPSDYWRFTPDAFAELFDAAGIVTVEIVADPDPASPGVFGVGRKPVR